MVKSIEEIGATVLHRGVSKSLQFLNLLNCFHYWINGNLQTSNNQKMTKFWIPSVEYVSSIIRPIFHRFIFYSIVLCILVSENLLLNIFMEIDWIKNEEWLTFKVALLIIIEWIEKMKTNLNRTRSRVDANKADARIIRLIFNSN